MNRILTAAALILSAAILSSCVSGDVLESASTTSAPLSERADESEAVETVEPQQDAETLASDTTNPAQRNSQPPQQPSGSSTLLAAVDPVSPVDPQNGISAGEADGTLQPPLVKGPEKTYLINGLLSAVPFIGYGFRNLKKKIPGAKLYSYMGVVEGPAAIAPEVIKDATAAWRADPTTRINLVGISLGADLITVIAEKLEKNGVPVAYLGIVDGTNLRPITANVKVADNLTCSNLDCTRATARLAKGNTTTLLTRKVYRSSHIPLGDHDEMHARVIAQTR